jgi:hypothetical protein
VPTIQWTDVTRDSSELFPDYTYTGQSDEPPETKLSSLSYDDVTPPGALSRFSTSSYSGEDHSDSVLQIDALGPWDHGRKLQCQASNSHLMEAVSVAVSLDIFCKYESF